MSLTALIAELFVGGVFCLIWILLLCGAFVDVSPLIAIAKDNALGGTVLFSVFAYALGVVFDRVWDDALKRFADKAEKTYFPEKQLLKQARRRVFGKDADGAEFVNYIRSRMRIARAVFCNGLLIGVSGTIFYLRRSPFPQGAETLGIALCTVFICAVAFVALKRLTVTYYGALQIFADAPAQPIANLNADSVSSSGQNPPPS